MNEVIINPNEVESIWEKDNVCFVKMKTGKVWLCELYQDIKGNVIFHTFLENKLTSVKTIFYITKLKSCGDGFIKLSLSQKGKSENNG